jgi:hypothetical protein
MKVRSVGVRRVWDREVQIRLMNEGRFDERLKARVLRKKDFRPACSFVMIVVYMNLRPCDRSTVENCLCASVVFCGFASSLVSIFRTVVCVD